jgi:hypothetical protein
MLLELNRVAHNADATHGNLLLDGQRFCHTLEDQPQPNGKVMDETRIPAGRYDIKLRNVGGMTKKYAARYPFHEGMLWLQDVPEFSWVYIHSGNTHHHTSGCVLVGYTFQSQTFTIGRSRDAYTDLYQAVVDAARGEELRIQIRNEENG